MCKFCDKKYEEKDVFIGRSRSGRSKYEKRKVLVNTSWDDANWHHNTGYGEQKGSIMDVELDTRSNEILFGYNAYSCDSSFDSKLKINFCPFCGNKLNNHENNNQSLQM